MGQEQQQEEKFGAFGDLPPPVLPDQLFLVQSNTSHTPTHSSSLHGQDNENLDLLNELRFQ